ncbi:MAG: ATP synthase subunit I [Actinomycetota bacterium]
MTGPEPERALIRRVSPFAVPAVVVAYVVGALFGGATAGWSAAIAIVIVYLNFVANALSIAWAASTSPPLVSIVALGGYVVRLIVYTIALVLLNQLSWFSPVAFALALVPAIVALLIYEAKALSGRMQADLWTFDGAPRR